MASRARVDYTNKTSMTDLSPSPLKRQTCKCVWFSKGVAIQLSNSLRLCLHIYINICFSLYASYHTWYFSNNVIHLWLKMQWSLLFWLQIFAQVRSKNPQQSTSWSLLKWPQIPHRFGFFSFESQMPHGAGNIYQTLITEMTEFSVFIPDMEHLDIAIYDGPPGCLVG